MRQAKLLAQRDPGQVHLLQFTDTHICSGPGQTFAGADTEKSLKQVIAHARKMHWPPDAILVTGDLVHDPSVTAYERLLAILKTTECPVFCIPGNHDEPHLMRRILETGNISMAKSILFARWIICLLDTFVPGTHAGGLDKTELEFLDQCLTAYRDKHALICLHHPPMVVGSPWLDKMGLQNPAELFSITDRHPQSRGVICGHVHQEFSGKRGTLQLFATPSTCVQFTPGSVSYGQDDKPPAYRHLLLHAGGEIETEVVNVPIRGRLQTQDK